MRRICFCRKEPFKNRRRKESKCRTWTLAAAAAALRSSPANNPHRHGQQEEETTTCPFHSCEVPTDRVAKLKSPNRTKFTTQPQYAGMFYKSMGWISHIRLGKEPKERPKVIGPPCLLIGNALSPLRVKRGAILPPLCRRQPCQF